MFDIESELVNYLLDSGFAAFGDVPEDKRKPQEFVTVERTGGTATEHVKDDAMVAVQSWAASRADASILAIKVDESVRGFLRNPRVCKVRRQSLVNFPSENGEPRYQAIYEITTTLD